MPFPLSFLSGFLLKKNDVNHILLIIFLLWFPWVKCFCSKNSKENKISAPSCEIFPSEHSVSKLCTTFGSKTFQTNTIQVLKL
mmetsp:Transcript_33887/g.78259  ORF Transcript_33887/g.78259 Transcript_33887/m.78259 type:complete len:83 (-) Transcript_33887:26-274(-)